MLRPLGRRGRDYKAAAESAFEGHAIKNDRGGLARGSRVSASTDDASDPLLDALDDNDPWVRLSAIESMGARNDPRDTPRLLEALKDPSSSVRVFAIIALADRSEERRVGKECRSRWSPHH